MSLQDLADQASRLSVSDRLALMDRIVKSLQSELGQTPGGSMGEDHRSALINQMRGFLRTDHPAPTDEEVEAMLEERRIEKYS